VRRPLALVAAVVLSASAGCASGGRRVEVVAEAAACRVGSRNVDPGRYALAFVNKAKAPADVSLLRLPGYAEVVARRAVPPGHKATLRATLGGGQYQVVCGVGGGDPIRTTLFVTTPNGAPPIGMPDGDRVVDVAARDFGFANLGQLGTPEGQVYAGEEVVFRLTNKGPSAHTFVVRDADGRQAFSSGRIAAGASARGKFIAPRGGVYTYLCVLPGHAARGMTGTFSVVVTDADRTPS
jgi:uncharacterized cupredoxin-like copper-binding protein